MFLPRKKICARKKITSDFCLPFRSRYAYSHRHGKNDLTHGPGHSTRVLDRTVRRSARPQDPQAQPHNLTQSMPALGDRVVYDDRSGGGRWPGGLSGASDPPGGASDGGNCRRAPGGGAPEAVGGGGSDRGDAPPRGGGSAGGAPGGGGGAGGSGGSATLEFLDALRWTDMFACVFACVPGSFVG